MRLPADATLIVIGIADGSNSGGPANVARLIEAWRAEELPIVHVRTGLTAAEFPAAPRSAREPEPVIKTACADAFAASELEVVLEDIGATTLTLCGDALAVEATAREAAGLGFHVFVVKDACREADGQEPSFAGLRKESATVVGLSEALHAAAAAKARQRHRARKE